MSGFESIWIRSPNAEYWVYSLTEPTRVTLRCRPGGSSLADDETYEKTLSGTGSLPSASTCYVYSETFKLLPHSLGRTLARINKAHIVLPHTQGIVRSDEKCLLEKPSHLSTAVIHRAAGVANRKAVEVARLIEELKTPKAGEESLTTWRGMLGTGLALHCS